MTSVECPLSASSILFRRVNLLCLIHFGSEKLQVSYAQSHACVLIDFCKVQTVRFGSYPILSVVLLVKHEIANIRNRPVTLAPARFLPRLTLSNFNSW